MHNKLIVINRAKFLLITFFEILTSQKKSQLISAVCLHFSQKTKISKILRLQTENCITVC